MTSSAALEGAVARLEGDGDEGGERAGGDDAAAALAQGGQGGAGDGDGAEVVDGHLFGEFLAAGELDGPGDARAGVVYEGVEPAFLLEELFDGGLDGGFAGDVEVQQGEGQAVGLVGAVGAVDPVAFLGEEGGNGEADAA